jgi:hypothetical protein
MFHLYTFLIYFFTSLLSRTKIIYIIIFFVILGETVRESQAKKKTLVVIILLCIGTTFIPKVDGKCNDVGNGHVAVFFQSKNIKGAGIPVSYSKISVSEKLLKSSFHQSPLLFPLRKSDADRGNFPLFSLGVPCQNPALVFDKGSNVLVLSEVFFDEGIPSIMGRWSADWGWNWVDEDYMVGWNVYDDVKRPKLDYAGKDSTAWGTFTAGSQSSGCVYYLSFPDITDPGPWDGYPWELWYIDWMEYWGSFNFDSADVACYSNESHTPSSDFFGVIAITGDSPPIPPGGYEDNTLGITFFDDGGARLFFFTDVNEDCSNVVVEIDQTNGRLYLVSEYENNILHDDGTLLLYHDISSDIEWYEGAWPGYYFENLFNPSVAVDNGAVCVVGERERGGQRDIVSYCSVNAGLSFFERNVTDTPGNQEAFPSITTGSIPIPEARGYDEVCICSYLKDDDIMISESVNHGDSWEEFPLKMNDDTAVPVKQYGALTMDDVYLAWTDWRNTPTEVYFDKHAYPLYSWPEIVIRRGVSIGVAADIIAVDVPAYCVQWTLDASGGFLLGEKNLVGYIQEISADGAEQIRTGVLFGFGRIFVTINVEPWFGHSVTKTAEGWCIGPFVFMKK